MLSLIVLCLGIMKTESGLSLIVLLLSSVAIHSASWSARFLRKGTLFVKVIARMPSDKVFFLLKKLQLSTTRPGILMLTPMNTGSFNEHSMVFIVACIIGTTKSTKSSRQLAFAHLWRTHAFSPVVSLILTIPQLSCLQPRSLWGSTLTPLFTYLKTRR
jgi:hypothetical protein